MTPYEEGFKTALDCKYPNEAPRYLTNYEEIYKGWQDGFKEAARINTELKKSLIHEPEYQELFKMDHVYPAFANQISSFKSFRSTVHMKEKTIHEWINTAIKMKRNGAIGVKNFRG